MLIPILLLGVETVALTGATVHTLEPGAAPAVATVLIENDRIAAVGPDLAIPEGARRVDLSGLHLVPGLVDGMVNHDPDQDLLYVSAGVTLVRDVGNDITRILAELDRNARERWPGPWIWNAGAVLDGFPPATTHAAVMTNAEEANDKIARLLDPEWSIDYFSFLPGIPRDAWTAVLERAHKAGKQVWGTLPRGATLDDALAAGQDGLFHLDALLPAGKAWTDVTFEELEPVIEKVAAGELRITPTLALWARALVAPKEDDPELALLGPYYLQTWGDDARLRRKNASREHLETGLRVVEMQSRVVKRLHERGAALVPGSATPNPWLFPGRALLDELLLWRRAGISDADCLRAATSQACEHIGAKMRGTITKAKYADLVAVAADPTQDIAALRDPPVVVLRGRVLRREEIEAGKQKLRERQAAIRDDLSKALPVPEPELPPGDVVLRGHVETRAIGVRVSAERFAVVRRYDGSLEYCGHLVTPGQASMPDTDTVVRQTIQGGNLVAFEVTSKSGGKEISTKGTLAGGKMNVMRRADGGFVDNVSVVERLAFVDCGSATAWLILGYHKKPGAFHVAFFDDHEPAVGRWEMALDGDGITHLARTPTGDAVAKFDARGVPTEVRRAKGNAVALTKLLDARVEDGRGLPMPADKKALAGTGTKKPEAGGTPRAREPEPADGGQGAPR